MIIFDFYLGKSKKTLNYKFEKFLKDSSKVTFL